MSLSILVLVLIIIIKEQMLNLEVEAALCWNKRVFELYDNLVKLNIV